MDNEQIEQKEEKKTPTDIVASSEVNPILGDTFHDRFRMCKVLCSSGMVPKGYETPEKVFTGIQYAIELGFDKQPITALKNIAVINGMPSIWGELPLALVKKSGLLDGEVKEFFVDKDNNILPPTCKKDEVYAAVCTVKRKGEEAVTRAFTKDDKSGLGVASIWNKFEKIMMKRKARATALKDVFPDVLLGIAIGEYEHHKPMELVNSGDTVKTPQQEELDKINSKIQGAINA